MYYCRVKLNDEWGFYREDTLDVGPASFIDSERVNAVPSLELDTDTEDAADTSINILQHIPEVELQTNLREV